LQWVNHTLPEHNKLMRGVNMNCQHGTKLYEYDENCKRCMTMLEALRPWSDEEAMRAGYPHKPIGSDDRHTDTY